MSSVFYCNNWPPLLPISKEGSRLSNFFAICHFKAIGRAQYPTWMLLIHSNKRIEATQHRIDEDYLNAAHEEFVIARLLIQLATAEERKQQTIVENEVYNLQQITYSFLISDFMV